MKRLAISAALALAASFTVAAGADGAATQPPPPRAHLRTFVCQHALDPGAREISVVAVMRPLHGTEQMAMRFDLLSRSKPSGGLSALRGPELGSWISPPDPTLGRQPGDVWNLSHPVDNLVAPATYHFRVMFRWTGAHGRVLGTAVRLSPPCYQPELRPDLLVQSIIVNPITGDLTRDRYVAVIRNDGATGAGPFQVLFAPGAATAGGTPPPPKTRTVQRLAAHGVHELTFVGPACTAATAPTITVDPSGQVDDLNPANNSLKAVCP
jgi:hypothetical protein